jgi:hypothetical protein
VPSSPGDSALVEEPVGCRDDLGEDEIDYVRSQLSRLERLLADKFRLALEARTEGWLTVDESGQLTDLRWPDYGAAKTAALRISEVLRAHRHGGEAECAPRWRCHRSCGTSARSTPGAGRRDRRRLGRLEIGRRGDHVS